MKVYIHVNETCPKHKSDYSLFPDEELSSCLLNQQQNGSYNNDVNHINNFLLKILEVTWN